MLSVSALLMVSASSRFSGVAWGSLMDLNGDESVSLDGFIVIDLSYTEEPRGASSVFSLPLPEISVPLGLPRIEEIGLDLELPASVRIANLQLPSLIDELTVDFGPLPRELEEFEAIILSTTDDGLRLPDDFMVDLPDVELLYDDIILAEVGTSWKEHVVRAGETLSDIALQYGGITVQEILRANELRDPNRLAVQQILLIPNSREHIEATLEEVRTRKARVAALREQVKPLQVTSYVVVAGDSLWSIAGAKNLEVDTLIGSNVFRNSSLLRPGMTLRIPNQDGIFYTFRSEDKIDDVARRYRIAVDRIRQANPTVDLHSLKAGNEIFLPGARPAAIARPESTRGSTATSSVNRATRNFRWPVMGRISSPYGWRRHPITRRNDFHSGIDIRAARGTVIRAARDGRVTFAGWMGAYGKTVVIEHAGGQSSLYAHCSSILVRQGDRVTAGQNIARVGATGRATGPHLHFEIRNGNRPVNPLQYLR